MKTKSNKKGGTEYISRDVVRLLKEQEGWTLKEIGKVVGCGESFISMVGSGKRSFTLDHLTMLEKKLGEPVAIFLFKSIDPEKIDKQLKPLYNNFMLQVIRKPEVKARGKRKAARSRVTKRTEVNSHRKRKARTIKQYNAVTPITA